MKKIRPGYPVGRDVPIERKILLWVLLVCALVLFFLSPFAMHAQERSNTFFVSEFKGADVGAKITAAQASCASNTSIPCVIVIDAIFAVWPQGSIPARCANCIWIDYRSATFTAQPFTISPGTSIVLNGATSGAVTQTTVAVAGTQSVVWPAASGTPILDTAIQSMSNKSLVSPTSTGTDNGVETLGSKTLNAPIIGTTKVSEAPRMVVVNGFLPGNLTATLFASAVISNPITVESIAVQSTVVSSCTVNPTLRVRNSGSTVVSPSVTLTSGSSTWITSGNSVNYPGSDEIFIEVTSAGTCTTPPANINVNVIARMQ